MMGVPPGYVAASAHSRLEHICRTAVVAEVDLDAWLLRVSFEDTDGDTLSPWIPWAVSRASAAASMFVPPEVGERVCVFSPSGDTEAAFVFGALPADESLIPGDTSDRVIKIGALTITVKANGDVSISTSGQITLDASVVTVLSDLGVDGEVAAQDDVSVGLVTLLSHIHLFGETAPPTTGKTVAASPGPLTLIRPGGDP